MNGIEKFCQKSSLQALLKNLEQESLLPLCQALSFEKQENLIKALKNIDGVAFHQQRQQLKRDLTNSKSLACSLEPFDALDNSGNAALKAAGQEAIDDGLMGTLIVAGGQGSRLGLEGPKGTYPISVVKHKSLFQLFAEKCKAASKRAGKDLSLAIMTSPLNHKSTRDFFKEHGSFGLKEGQIDFFSQECLPFLDDEGRLLIDEEGQIAAGPDGNGKALHYFVKSGLWQKWWDKGIRYLNFILVDNPLADPFDAELIGYAREHGCDIVIKTIKRKTADEPVGLLAKRKGHPAVVEYSEVSEDERKALDESGNMRFAYANISLFCFSMEFVHCAFEKGHEQPLHRAYKSIGQGVIANANPLKKAWKFEYFIFDLLEYTAKIKALLYPREQCFAPLKNSSGEDSPATVQAALQQNDQRVLRSITELPCEGFPLELAQDYHYPTAGLLKACRSASFCPSGYLE